MIAPVSDADVLRSEALHDVERLAAVERTGLFRASPDAAFARAVRLVHHLLDVPVAHFTVVGSETQVYKAQVGLPEPLASECDMPLEGSLCKHVVDRGVHFVVSDASAEPRLAGNPSVDAFGVRAYLGAPVRDPEGHIIGSLCGLDMQVRAWTPKEAQALEDIVSGVESEIALRIELRARELAATVEHERRVEAERLALVAERTNNGVLITDDEGRAEWINAGLTRITGYTADDLIGRRPADVMQSPDADANTTAHIQAHVQRRESFAAEVLNRHRDGHLYWVRIEATPRIGADGSFSGYISIETDVTERREAENALRESEAQYRSVVHNIHDAVLMADLDGQWTFLSPAWETITGYTVEESLGQTAREFVHPDAVEHHAEMFAQLRNGVPTIRFENRLVTKDGETRHIEVQAQLRYDSSGEVVGTMGTVSDITDTVRFAAEHEARERAEEMTRLKSAFLNNMSHELRTPLTGILGFAEILAEDARDDQVESVDIIVRSAMRLQDTLNSVLDLAQIESGTIRLSLEPLDLLAETQDALAVLVPLAQAREIRLDVSGERSIALADQSALHRILYNLVGNAIKFTDTGGVSVRVERDGDKVRLRISDTGIGIAEAFLPRLFDEFTQASEGYSRTHEGNGLGLSITRRLTELMGGTIDVESQPDVGTAFTVAFPTAEAPRRQAATAVAA